MKTFGSALLTAVYFISSYITRISIIFATGMFIWSIFTWYVINNIVDNYVDNVLK